MVVHRQRRCLGADERRSRTRSRVPAGRIADRRLLRRQSSGRRPLRREHRRARREDRPRKWHYQLVHHGIWDMDIPCAPILADLTVNGRTIKAIAQPTKQAWVYVLDRATGQPVWPIEERPVEKGTVPGEWYSPTQPFVTKPPAFDRQGVSVDDLIDFTPALHEEALKTVGELQDRSDLHAACRQHVARVRWRRSSRRRRLAARTGRAARSIRRRTSCTSFRTRRRPRSAWCLRIPRGATSGTPRGRRAIRTRRRRPVAADAVARARQRGASARSSVAAGGR